MKTLKYLTGLASILFVSVQCTDFLNTKNPGNPDSGFIISTPDETFKTLSWAYARYRQDVAAGGNYNFQDVLGSDAEYLNEYPTANNNIVARMQPQLTPITMMNGQYNGLGAVLARAAYVAEGIARFPQYQTDAAGSETTVWTQLYGEAITLWAHCYFKLTMHWGDIPFGHENQYVTGYGLTSRYAIYDNIIAKLKEVEGRMYPLGHGGITAERMSRTYANALIGEISLFAGGWQTIRTDVPGLYGDVTFETKGTDDGQCVYARRTDYMTYIEQAATYLDRAVNNADIKGTAKLYTIDARAVNGIDNPFQYHWDRINNRVVSEESLFEVGCLPGVSNVEHPYSQGRAGSNNSKNAVLNTFAAIRIVPTFFYSGYDDGDKRRDASMVVTGSDASTGVETLLPFGVATRITGGGPCINKWDANKADAPDVNFPTAGNRASGMNYTVLRMADAMLMLAEAKAILGNDNAGAIKLVNDIRARAFGNDTNAIGSLSGEALLDAIYNERRLELLGEGDIRWDMVRSGKFNERAIAVRAEMAAMVGNLRTQGYHTFANGKTINSHVWTKAVFLNGTSGVGVTYDSPDPTDPVRTPGWRGIYEWPNIGYGNIERNLAIRGLYTRPTEAEIAAWEADGYTRVPWGANIVTDVTEGRNIYDDHILDGVKGRENMAPRYFHPLPQLVISQSNGNVTNGYGLPQS